MIERARLLSDRDEYRARAAGALVGLAIGDAVGDLGRDPDYRSRFGLVTELAPQARGTDDTEFSILTARTLLDCGGRLTAAAVEEGWRRYILAYGGAKKRAGRPLYGAIENLRRGLSPPESGRFTVMNDDDGAAMRVAAIGIYRAGEPDEAARLAGIDACISHDGDGISAAKAIAASTSVAMANGTVEEIVEAGLRFMPAGSWLRHAATEAMEICTRSGAVERAYHELHERLWTPEHAASAEAIPQAYALFRLTRGDFRGGLLWSANFGRDADTIAALTCSLSGALHGVGVVPEGWVEQVRRPAAVCLEFTREEDLLSLADELTDLAIGEGGS